MSHGRRIAISEPIFKLYCRLKIAEYRERKEALEREWHLDKREAARIARKHTQMGQSVGERYHKALDEYRSERGIPV